MPTYALLTLPSSNRVYAQSAAALTLSELALFSESAMGGRLHGFEQTVIGGVTYVTFRADTLDSADAAFLANMSSIYALFQVTDDALRPVELRPLDRFDDDLLTIQKYPGKTNEQFTKLLINVTVLASAFADRLSSAGDSKLALLDPLCGRGTTLNQALMFGWDAAGIDHDAKDFEAYSTFIQTWLKQKRIKHHAEAGPVRRERRVVGRRLRIELAAAKEDYKAGQTQHLDVVNADTVKALEFFRPQTFHVVVADAPYGVQHGSRTAAKGLTRSPLDLLAEATPAWSRLLKPGGAVGLSWNTRVARREAATRILAESGLVVMDSGPHHKLAHRVDQAINRDILVARKPSGIG
jgi:SAM-dependent methyltransferase